MRMISIKIQLPQDLLEQVDEARGLVSRAAWIRAAVEENLYPFLRAEGVAPSLNGISAEDAIAIGRGRMTREEALANADSVRFDVKGSPGAEGLRAAVQTEATHRRSGLESESPSSFVEVPAQPVSVTNRGREYATTQEPPSLEQPAPSRVGGKSRKEARPSVAAPVAERRGGLASNLPSEAILPAQRTIQHCNRGVCRGTLHPRTNRCNLCMQLPLKESK